MKIEYNNLYTHFVLTTYRREPLIPESSRKRIEKYITGIINHNNCRLYAIFANPEHVHFLVSRSPGLSEEHIATIVANSSAKFINDHKLSDFFFRWQLSASAFSVSKKDIDRVCWYILNQPEHHKKTSFQQEYDDFIRFYQKSLIPKNG